MMAGEQEQRQASQHREDVQPDEAGRQLLVARRGTEEERPQGGDQPQRRHHQPERVQMDAGARGQVNGGGDERRHRQEEVQRVNRTFVAHEARDDHVDRMRSGADPQEHGRQRPSLLAAHTARHLQIK
jgi:hypothetical protein